MIAFFNGGFMPEGQARISAFDRGFLYGDGLFETVRVYRGRLFEWEAHWERFFRGAEYLQIPLRYSCKDLRSFMEQLVEHNNVEEAVVRLHLSRGTGPRGYSPREARNPMLVATAHPIEIGTQGWKLASTSFRLAPMNPVSGFKTLSKVTHVAAKAEAEKRGAHEGLLLTADGMAGQGTASNIFWVEDGTVCTPPLDSGVLPGVTRAVVLELCGDLKLQARECTCPPDALRRMSGIFITLSSYGIVEVTDFDSVSVATTGVTKQLQEAFRARTMSGV
jgi:branched-chain amino acid aminotransferase